MKLTTKNFLRKDYEVRLCRDSKRIELWLNGQLSIVLTVDEIRTFNYFKPRYFLTDKRYWVSLKSVQTGVLLFPAPEEDKCFLNKIVNLFSKEQLNQMKIRSLRVNTLIAIFSLSLISLFYIDINNKKYPLLGYFGLLIFSGAILSSYIEINKFKKYMKLHDSTPSPH